MTAIIKNNGNGNENTRSKLAKYILIGSLSGIFVFALVVIYRGDEKSAKEVFDVLLPLLGSWIGTVLAFYFSRENFESANRSVREMARQLTSIEKLKSIPVKEKMILKSKMLFKNLDKNSLAQLKLIDLLNELTKRGRNRIPIFNENDFPLYMIHRSMIDKYLTQKAFEGLPKDKLSNLTLKNLLDEEAELKKMFEKSFVTVRENATLADAKFEMEGTPNCLDVFVTKHGTTHEPVIGYLTNMEITENAWV